MPMRGFGDICERDWIEKLPTGLGNIVSYSSDLGWGTGMA
jgi:hypothetical protein